ncbi:FAD-dependent oxidoreductase, partial [Burkholderia sp. SIMBA_019]|uniref:FAD-dependent oxidoreductase n=1 Tax=Burkholderia sp. SIMBA_019 TaxID=3085765 RepID=UPI00397D7DBC
GSVQFKNGEIIPADLVVMAAGIRPNTELAEKSGIPCNRGILVNDTMQTYDPRVYAIGECAAFNGAIFGLVAPGYQMARTAAADLCGDDAAAFQGADMST